MNLATARVQVQWVVMFQAGWEAFGSLPAGSAGRMPEPLSIRVAPSPQKKCSLSASTSCRDGLETGPTRS